MKKRILVLALFISACNPSLTPEQIIQQVQQSGAQDTKTAILLLKNGLQESPNNQQLKELLAQKYFIIGDYASAIKELERLIEANYNREDNDNLLLKTLYLNADYEEVLSHSNQIIIERSQDVSQQSLTNTYLFQGLAYYNLGDFTAAKHSLTSATEVSAGSVYDQLSNAISFTTENRPNDAIALLDDILNKQPKFIEALLLKGQLLTQEGRYSEAVTVFGTLKEDYPFNNRFKLFYVGALAKDNQLEKAKPLVNELFTILPQNGFVQQLKAVIAYDEKDFVNAKLHAENAMKGRVYNVQIISLVGLSALQLGDYEQAKSHLDMIVQKFPENHPITQAKIIVNSKLGNEKDNILLLSEQDLSKVDPSLLVANAYQFINLGEEDFAGELINAVNTHNDSLSPSIISKNRLLAIALNNQENITQLEEAIAADENDLVSQRLLAIAYLKNKEFEKVEPLITDLNQNEPRSLHYVLLGMSKLGLGAHSEADAAFEQALALDPSNIPSLHYFAEMHMARRELDSALEFTLKALQQRPDDLKTLDFVYRITTPTGRLSEYIYLIEDAFKIHTSNIDYRILFATGLFALEQYDNVKNLLSPIVVTPRTPGAFFSLLASSYLQLNQPVEAKRVFAQWRSASPKTLEPYIQELAVLEIENNNLDSLKLVNQALRHHPHLDTLKLIKANTQIRLGRYAEARISLNKLSPKSQTTHGASIAFADIAVHEKRYKDALDKYLSAYSQRPDDKLAHKIADTYFADGQALASTDFLASHIDAFPSDTISQFMRASKLLDVDPKLAQDALSQLDSQYPNNVFLKNNLANSLLMQNRLSDAEKYAKQALDLNSEHPQVLDTLAMVKLAQKQISEATLYSKMAYDKNPFDVAIALNYAEILIFAENITEAQRILNSVSSKDAELLARINQLKERIDS